MSIEGITDKTPQQYIEELKFYLKDVVNMIQKDMSSKVKPERIFWYQHKYIMDEIKR